MSASSKIEWTDSTWNPVRGCSKVSPGCKHCYAETFAERFRDVKGHPFEFGFDLRLVPEKLGDPINWLTPRKIFVNSMSDLFHEDVHEDYIGKVCRVMLAANWHTYQILTKRAERMSYLLRTKFRSAAVAPHIWWGVSVENRQHGLPRIDLLRRARVAIAFLSVEPLIEDLGQFSLSGIHWVIVGGKVDTGLVPSTVRGSGPSASNARPPMCPSSSNNGVESVRPKPDGCWMGKHMTNFRRSSQIRWRASSTAVVSCRISPIA